VLPIVAKDGLDKVVDLSVLTPQKEVLSPEKSPGLGGYPKPGQAIWSLMQQTTGDQQRYKKPSQTSHNDTTAAMNTSEEDCSSAPSK